MNKENKIVPKLRFPEFLNSSDWSEDTLGNNATFLKGKGISKSDIAENGIYPCIRYGELYTHYRETIRNIRSYTNLPLDELILSQANDVIIPASGETKEDIATASCVMESGIALGGDLNIIRSKINGIFLSYYLNNVKKKDIAKVAQGISVVHLYPDQLKSLNIHTPQPAEQQKIASFLSSLDELINAHIQKLDALKDHKKGLMQQLFPEEGETVPKIRFKEFEKDGEWKEMILDDVADYENGKAHENDIVEAGKYILVNSKFISTDGEVRKFTDSPFCLASRDDILMVLSDVPNGRAIAKCFIVDKDELYTVNQRICKLTPKGVVGIMLYYTLNRHPYLLSFDDGVKQTNLRKEDVLNCPIVLPENPDEQKQIAKIFISIDEQINTQTLKIDELKEYKKGLMQGLFPTINY
jgi:type I restriction enzyme S subunit